MSAQPVLVVGATSGTGVSVVRDLLARGVQVRVGARSPERARAQLGASVEVVPLDLDRPGPAFADAIRGAAHVIVTAAVPRGFARERTLRRTELDGLLALAGAAREVGLAGRFVYLTTLGVHVPSFAGWVVDTVKWNMLAVRREAEVALAATGLDVALVRAGMLVDAGARPLRLWRGDAPLRLAGKVSRADVAALLVDLLDHPGVADVSVEWSASGAAEGRLGSLIDAAA